jgi:hypothetical protein
MDFSFAYLKRVLPLAAAVLGAVFSVQAQRAALRPGQSILFSSPESDTVFSNLPSLSPKPPESLDFGNTLQAPPSFSFSGPSVDTPLPVGVPVVSPAEALRLQDLLDKRKNWMLMTPAEILGATTPEKILGIQEHDAAGRPKNLTALERYTERQNQTPTVNTNTNVFPTWNFSDKRPDTLNSIPGELGSPDNLPSSLLNPAPNNQTFAGQNGNKRWSKLFGSPSPSPVVTMAQQMNMERFRQLLKPGSSSTAAATTPSLSGIKTSLPQTALSSGLGQFSLTPVGASFPLKLVEFAPLVERQSSLTPVGASFTPLNNGIGKPAEMPKLPSIWSLSLTSPPSAVAWGPQPPPWLSLTPQPFAIPQRKF